MAKKKTAKKKTAKKKTAKKKTAKKKTAKKKTVSWKVKRVKQDQAIITLPKGMKFTSQDIDIEDIIEAIQKHGVISGGQSDNSGNVVVKCCSGNTAIA